MTTKQRQQRPRPSRTTDATYEEAVQQLSEETAKRHARERRWALVAEDYAWLGGFFVRQQEEATDG